MGQLLTLRRGVPASHDSKLPVLQGRRAAGNKQQQRRIDNFPQKGWIRLIAQQQAMILRCLEPAQVTVDLGPERAPKPFDGVRLQSQFGKASTGLGKNRGGVPEVFDEQSTLAATDPWRTVQCQPIAQRLCASFLGQGVWTTSFT